ncbi:hypothetical protein VW35_01785 [Devosia soli]|uniref:HTH arsR-type domain-containing protein n=1 Tax=Devosia soli TaxID=361041 RepID=A0A0F5LF58_9HYPH|nr:metalloregulator ArsR/SmtB family transcription factor [Devosia soli]KKB80940.1 hypothetical protein VW35_01785 [Devosia soli]
MSKKPKPPIALYSALADATRCRILELLRAGPMPVHVLTEAFSISRPAISRHLRVLKTAGLVAEVKKGRENLYAFKPAKLEAGRGWIEGMTAASAIVEAKPTKTIRITKSQPKRAEPAPVDQPRPSAAPAVPAANQMGFDF